MFCFSKVKVKKSRVFLADLYAAERNNKETLVKKDMPVVVTKHGFVEFEEIKDLSAGELRQYESNGFIAHFIKSNRREIGKQYIKNLRPLYPHSAQNGYVSYKEVMRICKLREEENENQM